MKNEAPSNRSFGWTFAAFFTLVGAYSLWRGGAAYPWSFGLAAVTRRNPALRQNYESTFELA
jgi:hypothetical protein